MEGERMTKAQLMASLMDYRKMCARIDVLDCRIRDAERRYSARGDISGMALSSPQLTGMPGAKGIVSRPTERLALELMRFPDERARLDVEADLRELDALISQKRRLDVLISGLAERERFVITAHLVSALRWRDVARRFAREFGEELTESALKYVMRRALDAMLCALTPTEQPVP